MVSGARLAPIYSLLSIYLCVSASLRSIPSCWGLTIRAPRFLQIAVASCAISLIGGCGYHLSGNAEAEPGYAWSTLYRGDVKSVSVPIFTNRTPYTDLEFALSKSVVNQLEAFSPYKVEPRERADTVLEGEITRVRTRTVSRNRTSASPQEQLYVIVVNFRWRDLRNGKILVERHDYEQSASFYPTLGEDPFVGQQENIERLAIAIVQELQADWGREGNDDKPSKATPQATGKKRY